MARRKQLTNVQFVKQFMESGSPLRQAFALEALAKYATACADVEPETFDSPLLSGKAWHAVAVEARDALNEHLSG